MVPALIYISAAIIAVVAWPIAASGIFCHGLHHPEWWVWPYYSEWFSAAGLWRHIGWNARTWVVLSAVMPTTALLIVGSVVVRAMPHKRRTSWQQIRHGGQMDRQSALYGTAHLASDTELKQNNLVVK